jgi:hypothetical protein
VMVDLPTPPFWLNTTRLIECFLPGTRMIVPKKQPRRFAIASTGAL